MIRTVDIIDEVIEFCITDRFKERGNGIASIKDIEPKTLIRLRAAILIEVSAYGLYPTFRNNHYPYVRLLARCSPEIREDCIWQRGKEDV